MVHSPQDLYSRVTNKILSWWECITGLEQWKLDIVTLRTLLESLRKWFDFMSNYMNRFYKYYYMKVADTFTSVSYFFPWPKQNCHFWRVRTSNIQIRAEKIPWSYSVIVLTIAFPKAEAKAVQLYRHFLQPLIHFLLFKLW